MIRLMRRLFWVTAAGGLAAGGWTFWKLRGNNDELPQGNWSPVPNTGSANDQRAASGADSTPQGFAGSAAGSASKRDGAAQSAGAKSAGAGTTTMTSAGTTSAAANAAASGSPAAKTSSTKTATSKSAKPDAKAAPAKSANAPKAKTGDRPAAAKSTKKAAKSGAANGAKSASKSNQKWVEPDDKGSCPADFAVKANNGSKIYHVPTGRSYKRTKAERCYATPEDAAADGYRPAKA